MDRYDMLTELNAYRQSRDVQDLFHAVMGMAGRVIEAQTEIVRLQARVDELERNASKPAPAPEAETVTISKANMDAALGKLTDIIERGQWWAGQEAANAYELLTGAHPSVQSAGPFPVKSDDPGM